jgi:hypothetical protein
MRNSEASSFTVPGTKVQCSGRRTAMALVRGLTVSHSHLPWVSFENGGNSLSEMKVVFGDENSKIYRGEPHYASLSSGTDAGAFLSSLGGGGSNEISGVNDAAGAQNFIRYGQAMVPLTSVIDELGNTFLSYRYNGNGSVTEELYAR